MDISKLSGFSTRDPLTFSGKHSGDTLRQYKKQPLRLLAPPKSWSAEHFASAKIKPFKRARKTATERLRDDCERLASGLPQLDVLRGIAFSSLLKSDYRRTASSSLDRVYGPSSSYIKEAIENAEKLDMPGHSGACLITETMQSEAFRDAEPNKRLLEGIQQRDTSSQSFADYQPLTSPMQSLAETLAEHQRKHAEKLRERDAQEAQRRADFNERLIKAQRRQWHETGSFKVILALGGIALGWALGHI